MANLQIAFLLLAGGLILFWLIFALIGPRRFDAPPAGVVLRYGSNWRTAALIFALAPPTLMACMVWLLPWRNETMLVSGGVCFLATSAIAGLLLIEVERVQVCLTDEGITRDSPWSRRTLVKWSEIERIQYSRINAWFIVQSANRKVRLSRHLVGMDRFIEMVRNRVAAERYVGVRDVFDRMK